MRKRLCSLLLAVCLACTTLVIPASASGYNTAVQTALILGGLTSDQAANPETSLTRGQLAQLLAAFSPYRESVTSQGTTGTLFSDVNGSDALAPYIRIAVQQGWMSGYTDSSFRPDNNVTLEEACAAVLNLLGYDVTTLSGTFNDTATALGGMTLADNVEILDTTAEGVAGTIRPSRLAGVTLKGDDVRYYTTNEQGEIDRLILDDVTGDLWTYGVLDDVRNLVNIVDDSSDTTTTTDSLSSLADNVLPSTSEILYSIIDGSIVSTLWESLTSSPSSIISYLLNVASDNTSGVLSSVLGYLGKGANYVCYIDGENTTLQTSVKYLVIAGGIAVGKSASGTVKSMVQLMPVMVDQLGAASVKSGDTRYETADDMQVYLWYKGQYFPTTLSQINTEDYYLIGWYDNFGCTAGNKIRVLVAVQKD